MLSKDHHHGFTTFVLSIHHHIPWELTFRPNFYFGSRAHTSNRFRAALYLGDQLTPTHIEVTAFLLCVGFTVKRWLVYLLIFQDLGPSDLSCLHFAPQQKQP